MNKQTIKLKIQNGQDRENIVNALANGGYKVWVEEEKDNIYNITYFVLFEKKKDPNDLIDEIILKNKVIKILQEFEECFFCDDEGGEERKTEIFVPKILDCINKK